MEDLSKYNPDGSILRKAQLKMLELLIVVAKICDNNNISYWLSSGTLLGAVRHEGFIPWDDDVDIEVNFKDYKKLLKLLEIELPSNLTLQYKKNDKNYHLEYAKVRDCHSIIHEDGSVDFKERGIFIDIFPREYSTRNLAKIYHKLLGGSLAHLKLSMYSDKRRTIYQRVILNSRILLSKSFIFWARLLSQILPNKKMYALSFCNSANIGVDEKIIFPLKDILFEGYKFKCPADSDTYLKIYYGDYMKLPSLENRIFHSTKIEFHND